MADEIEKIDSKYKEAIKKFIILKIENPKLSVRKFCDAEGIPHQSFDHLLIQYPLIMQRIRDGIRERYHLKSLDVDEALYQKALKGDPRAIELWYRRMEKWNPSQLNGGSTIIRIVFAPGMLSEDEKSIIEVKGGGQLEIINAPGEDPVLDLPKEIRG